MINRLNGYLSERFGQKIYKLALDINSTCPNRDGTLGTDGCIFCNGAGHFATRGKDIDLQIEAAKVLTQNKVKNAKYIAYFQSFTNTYAPRSYLEPIFLKAVNRDDIVALSIATRPDCLPADILDMLQSLCKIKPVFVELGLQTIHSETAKYIRRGYDLKTYDEAVIKLHNIGCEVVTHMILGLPFETREMMLETAKYIGASGADGIKIHLLHVLKNTELYEEYLAGKFEAMSMEDYISTVTECIKLLPKKVVIHRLTGDGERKNLIAPLWSLNKKAVLNALNRSLKDVIQGSLL